MRSLLASGQRSVEVRSENRRKVWLGRRTAERGRRGVLDARADRLELGPARFAEIAQRIGFAGTRELA